MPLGIQLLGPPQIQLEGAPVTAGRRAVVALLSYLSVTEIEHPGQRSSRDSLAELLWTDYDPVKGLANLRHTLWEVTKFIGEGWVIASHEAISMNPKADLTLDVAGFQSLLRQAAGRPAPALRIPLLAEAAKLYRDEFMAGFSLREGAGFNEWVLDRAEGLRRELAAALGQLVEDYGALDQAQSAIPYAQRLVELDPLNEAAHRRLMQLHALTDQPAAAIRQYQALEKLLRKELNLDPQPETRELYKKVRKGELRPAPAVRTSPPIEKAAPGHNLPVHLTTFVGRQREQNEVSTLLRIHRMVTLTGAGGIGKTRLAVQTGQSLLEEFPDGVWFVPLESLSDEDRVPQTVISFLGLAGQPNRAPLETLLDELRQKKLLMLLDNCEHMASACAGLAETLLKNCPGLKILVTSRDPLHLEGEVTYTVPPLSLPEENKSADLASSESIQLFAQRAALLLPLFEVTPSNVTTLARICERLAGIPLAVELAAAHLDIFTPEEILGQLEHSFDLLDSPARSALPRHRTMRAAIEWGWDLLAESERTLLRRLSVFMGGWTLQAAQAMKIGTPAELTGVLVRKSFVVVDRSSGSGTRFRFHEVVRSFALEKLSETEEEAALRDRHLEYFLELIRQLDPGLRGPGQEAWLERLFLERDNLHAALEWAARTHVQAGLFISSRLRTFWENCEQREKARWLLMI